MIDPDAAILALRQIPDLRKIYFFSGEAKVRTDVYLRHWEWQSGPAMARVAKFREAFPEVAFSFWPGAF